MKDKTGWMLVAGNTVIGMWILLIPPFEWTNLLGVLNFGVAWWCVPRPPRWTVHAESGAIILRKGYPRLDVLKRFGEDGLYFKGDSFGDSLFYLIRDCDRHRYLPFLAHRAGVDVRRLKKVIRRKQKERPAKLYVEIWRDWRDRL